MPVNRTEIRDTVRRYVQRFPEERDRLDRLMTAVSDGSAVTSRKEFAGHVTCGVVIVDSDWRVLHIRHNALGRWLLPGGHLEAEDASLTDAAVREAHEETGLTTDDLRPLTGFDGIPLDIDVHAIPDNPSKSEPDHWHFDFRFAFRLAGDTPITLQAEEVSGYDWLSPDAVAAPELRKKIASLLGWQ
jgi:8-oxo-dGTP pyrophosphatase MutT (NUDIX family)